MSLRISESQVHRIDFNPSTTSETKVELVDDVISIIVGNLDKSEISSSLVNRNWTRLTIYSVKIKEFKKLERLIQLFIDNISVENEQHQKLQTLKAFINNRKTYQNLMDIESDINEFSEDLVLILQTLSNDELNRLKLLDGSANFQSMITDTLEFKVKYEKFKDLMPLPPMFSLTKQVVENLPPRETVLGTAANFGITFATAAFEFLAVMGERSVFDDNYSYLLGKGYFKTAVSLADNDRSQARALEKIAESLAERKFFTRAIMTVEKYEAEFTQIAAGKNELEYTNQEKGECYHNSLTTIARKLSSLGNYARALEVAQKLGRNQFDVLGYVAEDIAVFGDLERALEIVESCGDEKKKVDSIEMLSEYFATAGRFDKAIELMNRSDSSNKYFLVLNIVRRLALAGKFDLAIQLLNANKSIIDSKASSRELKKLIFFLFKKVTSHKSFKEAFELANMIESVWAKSYAISLIWEPTLENIDESIRIASGIPDIKFRDQFFEDIIRILIQNGELKKAVRQLDHIKEFYKRYACLEEIAEELIVMKKFEEVIDLYAAIPSSLSQRFIFFIAADSFIKQLISAGKLDQFLRVLQILKKVDILFANEKVQAKIFEAIDQSLVKKQYNLAIKFLMGISDKDLQLAKAKIIADGISVDIETETLMLLLNSIEDLDVREVIIINFVKKCILHARQESAMKVLESIDLITKHSVIACIAEDARFSVWCKQRIIEIFVSDGNLDLCVSLLNAIADQDTQYETFIELVELKNKFVVYFNEINFAKKLQDKFVQSRVYAYIAKDLYAKLRYRDAVAVANLITDPKIKSQVILPRPCSIL